MFTNDEFTRLAQKYIDTVFRIALSYLKSSSEADDITQNVFLKLLQTDRIFESEEHIKAWLIRVTVNECKKLFRSPWNNTENIEDYAKQFAFSDEEHSDLFLSVMALPKKYRVPLLLYYYEDYSTAEIAELLKIPVPTVCTISGADGKCSDLTFRRHRQ